MLNSPELMTRACEATTLQDWGDESFVEPLTVWCEALNRESRLTPMGEMIMGLTVERLLINRLRLVDDLKCHPEIGSQAVVAPIVILGLPRTGTTKLQRLLSADPGAHALAFWRLLNPAPFPGWQRGEPDVRVDVARQVTELAAAQFPELVAAHPIFAEEADEEAFVMEMTFEALTNTLRANAPSYDGWLSGRPRDRVYETLKTLLRYWQWQAPSGPDRHWVLKSPLHLGSLDTLIRTFPDATIVHCHRDPAEVIASFCHMIELNWRTTSDEVDPHEVGDRLLGLLATETDRHLAQREALGNIADILDVHYAQIRDDPFDLINEIYSRRGTELTDEGRAAMGAWNRANPQHRHGRHTYSLERFGFTRSGVEKRFGAYIERCLAT